MSLGRLVGILVVILVLYAIISQPLNSAASVRAGGNALASAGTSLIQFLEGVAPGGGARSSTVSRTASTGSSGTGASTYRVRSGDTLSSIAARHSMSPATLAARNNLANRDLIVPGQSLSLR